MRDALVGVIAVAACMRRVMSMDVTGLNCLLAFRHVIEARGIAPGRFRPRPCPEGAEGARSASYG